MPEYGSRAKEAGVILKRALLEATRGPKFDQAAFIDIWFRTAGSAFFFLFKKNLSVTNIQMAELLALIRSHLSISDSISNITKSHLRFLAIPEFIDSLKLLLATFTNPNVKKPIDAIVGLYTDLFQQTIVLDPFYGSCVVYIPPHLSVDLRRVCAESGYIHSCGMTVFVDRVYKTEAAVFVKEIGKYLGRSFDGKPIIFAIYAREDWPDKQEKMPAVVSKGLEDVKVPAGKFFMGKHSIQRVVTKLEKQFKKKMRVARPGHLREDHASFISDGQVDRNRSLFLVVDRQIGENPRYPADTRFFICYEQQWINSNACHVFDEDKPAWIDHTTIPHTLMGAMINVTQPWWPKKIRLCDPCVGSGTTWLEALKYPQVETVCSDLDPMVATIAEENLSFFAKSKEELSNLKNGLTQLINSHHSLKEEDAFATGKKFYQACQKRAQTTGSWLLDDELVERFKRLDELSRYAFYLILKVERRSADLDLNQKQWGDIFRREINQQINAINFLLDEMIDSDDKEAHIAYGVGHYSRATNINFSYLINSPQKGTCVGRSSVTTLPPSSVDVIVTDPPYGFNTDEDPTTLARLYKEMIPTLVNALRDEGQLVLALPDWSHTGRQILAFTYKDFVTHQILLAADARGWEAIRSGAPVTRGRELFRAPFYWESDRALRRAILHFRFRRRPQRVGGSVRHSAGRENAGVD